MPDQKKGESEDAAKVPVAIRVVRGFGLFALLLVGAWFGLRMVILSGGERGFRPESTAVASLRVINTGAVIYGTTYPRRGYPATLQQMGEPAQRTSADENHAGLIDPVLASGERNGYRFTYAAKDSDGDGVRDAYAVHADPIPGWKEAKRHFFTDQTGVIRYEKEGPAGANSPPLQ